MSIITMDALFSSPTHAHAKKLLDATALDIKAIGSNLANAETPGYKRVHVSKSFQAQLNSMIDSGQVSELPNLKPTLEEDPLARTIKPDGNNVEIDSELMELNRASIEYQTMTQLISGSIKRLNLAISGRTS